MRSSSSATLLRALRTHQWLKNLLVFLPVLTAHKVLDLRVMSLAATAFVCFSLVASAQYLINDVLDRTADRSHPHKKSRPVASGALGAQVALAVAAVLAAGAALVALRYTGPAFQLSLLAYFVLATGYSLFLKQVLLLDLILLSSLYTIRIIAGGAITGIVISEWLLTFSMFFFTSLAFAKRFTELKEILTGAGQKISGRAYRSEDLEIVRVAGPVSGFMAILVLALYINSPQYVVLYRRPQFLWLICPLLAYWILRVWFLANRGALHHDPLMFALKDPASYVTGACCLALVLAAV